MNYKYDVIIVLGRGINSDGSLPNDSCLRVRKGFELFEQQLANKILMSGLWSYRLTENPVCSEALAMKKYAVELGINPDFILEENHSKDTLGNAYFSKVDFCLPNNWRNIAVVTSDDHLNRTKYIFDIVFGNDFEIDYYSSKHNPDHKAEDLKRENNSLHVLKEVISGIQAGDHQSIWNVMQTHHPGYSNNPTITT